MICGVLIPTPLEMIMNTTAKIALVYFCTRFHLYLHVYSLLLQRRGLTLFEISGIESTVIFTLFLMEVPTGVIADRIGRKWSVTLSTLLLMCGELLFLFSTTYPMYLLVATFTGAGFAFASGATEALVYDSLPVEDRENRMKRAMGFIASVGQIGFFVSPLVGSLIVAELTEHQFNIAIALTATALFVGVLISLTLHEPPMAQHKTRPSPLQIFREGLAELRFNPSLRRILLLTVFTVNFGGLLITTFAAPYLVQNAAPTFMIGLALSVGSLLAAFTQRNAYRVEQILGPQAGLALLILLPGVFYLLLAALAGPVPIWLLITVMYATNDMKYPLLSAYQNTHITSANRATVLSLISMTVNLFVAIMAPIYAAIGTRSLPLAFVAIGLVILAAGGLLRVDRLVLSRSTPPGMIDQGETASSG
jgi:MFS family permease